MAIKIIICDDVQEFAEEIAEYVRKYPDIEISVFTSAEDVINDNTPYDIAFLDIEIGSNNGFDLATHIYSNNRECIISFFTSFSEYAVKGYSYNIFRYILKTEPTQMKQRLIRDAMQEYARRNKRLKIQSKNNSTYTPVRDIIYMESFKSTMLVHTFEETISWNKPINEAEEELSVCGFLRCHKSYIVNSEHIKSITDNRFLKLADGSEIPIGRKYKSNVRLAMDRR